MLIEKLVYVAQLGARVVLYLLIGLSILSIGTIVERWWYFRRRRLNVVETSEKLKKLLRSGDVNAARAELKSQRAPSAAIVLESMDWYADGPEAVEQILAKGTRDRRPQFESGLLFLGTLGNNAPFIGLFGTVLGILTAFQQLGQTQAGSSGGMGNVMGSIGESLVATAVGILVALPAVIAYNVFQKKAVDVEDQAASMGNVVIASLKANHEAASTNGTRHAHGKAAEHRGTSTPAASEAGA